MVLILLMAALLLQAPATGSIQGVILETGSRAPVSNVLLFAVGSDGRPAGSATSDANGRFAFPSLPAGEYHLIVAKQGFAFETVSAPAVIVASGRTATTTLDLPRAGSITGEVRDDAANPRRGVQVSVMRKVPAGTVQPPALPSLTDDLGRFHVEGLVPGDYLVLASPPVPAPRDNALLPTYYPSATDRAAAQSVTVAAGDVTAGIAIAMRTAPTYTVTGRVVDEQGNPVAGALVAFVYDSVRTQNGDQYSTHALIRAEPAREDGTFQLTRLGPGTYRLTPWPAPAPGTPPQQAIDATTVVNGTRATNVDVRDSDVSDVTVVLRRGGSSDPPPAAGR